MKSFKQINENTVIKEAITITISHIMKYLKTIQRDIGATDVMLSPVKNGLWQICFVEPRSMNGSLYLLMKNKETNTKLGVAYIVGYNVLGNKTEDMLDSFYQLPHNIKRFSDLKLSIRVLQNLKGLAKDPKTMAMKLDTTTAPDLEKEINAEKIKNVSFTNDLTKDVFSPYETDLAELGISKVEMMIPSEIKVIRDKDKVLLFSNSKSKVIVVKIDDEPTHFIEFAKGRFEVVSKLDKKLDKDVIIQSALSEFDFKFIYCVESDNGYTITSDFTTTYYSVYSKLPTSITSADVISIIFVVGESLLFQLAENKISTSGYEYDQSTYINNYGIGGWAILDTFIEGKKV